MSKPSRKKTASLSVLGRGDLMASLLLVFPLFCIYGMGVLFSDRSNGVDFFSRALWQVTGYDRTHYLLAYGLLAVIYGIVLVALRRKYSFELKSFAVSVFLESAIYALTLGTFVIFVMRQTGFDIQIGLSMSGSILQDVLMAMGAGVHEELVFRLGLMAGGAWLLKRGIGMNHRPAVIIACVVSAFVFSACHHLGALGDDFSVNVFVYRVLCGLFLGAIFYFRSFAHAVYAHFLYDVYVFVTQ